MRERLILSRRAFVEIVIWKLPRPLPDSKRAFKYRLAYIAKADFWAEISKRRKRK
jgi:hypothetical protein